MGSSGATEPAVVHEGDYVRLTLTEAQASVLYEALRGYPAYWPGKDRIMAELEAMRERWAKNVGGDRNAGN